VGVVKAGSAGVDSTEVTRSHAAERADRSSATIPRPRAAGETEGALEVREWHRYGRRRLYVRTADGRTVGWLSLNNGSTRLTGEAERSRFQAAIVEWFAPPPAPAVADAQQPRIPRPRHRRAGAHRAR
jgi:hypothetical protein